MRIFISISAILAWIFGVMLLLMPSPFYSPTGIIMSPMMETIAQAHGATLIGLGVINWLARDSDRKGIMAISAGNFVVQLLSLAVVIRTITIGAGASVAPGIIIHVLLGSFFVYFYFKARKQ
jgi:hypothetical protein